MKLWGGRFRKETDSLVNDFNSSIQFDCRLYREDIRGSIAHAAMLADCGIISREDREQIDLYLRFLMTAQMQNITSLQGITFGHTSHGL